MRTLRITVKHPLTSSSSSETGIRRSSALGGIDFAGGMMTSSYSCKVLDDDRTYLKNRPRKLVYLYQSATYILIQTEKRYSLETAHLKNIHVDKPLGRPPTLL